jgi:hypothetical protein
MAILNVLEYSMACFTTNSISTSRDEHFTRVGGGPSAVGATGSTMSGKSLKYGIWEIASPKRAIGLEFR